MFEMKGVVAFLMLILLSCQQKVDIKSTSPLKEVEKFENLSKQKIEKENITKLEFEAPTIIIIPCSNGYNYEIQQGTLNPFLEKSLSAEDKIILEDFPYKKMKGSGYFGIFDKKNCSEIIKNTHVDFLVMTKMIGGTINPKQDSAPVKWGYKTRIVNVKTMEQKEGISGDNLDSYESLAIDIESKKHQMVKLILQSWEN